MPPKPRTSIGHAEVSTQVLLDVLIVTALKEEYDAVLKVDTGSLPGSNWEPLQDPVSRNFSARSFVTASGGTLRVAVIQALDMGASSAVGIVSPLVRAYRPRCLAICGVCAGRPGKVELGDVLIAGRLWNYEAGKHTRLGDGSERFEPLDHGHELDRQWLQQARSFQPDARSAWLSERPRAYQAQMEWMLDRLAREEDPAQHPQHPVRCPDHTEVVKRLLVRKWACVHEAKLRLTETGREYIEHLRVLHPHGLPEPPDLRVHVGTMATGTKVIRDSTIFEKLSARDPNVLGLEMEAAEIATLAHQARVDFMIAVKGVTDFADEDKNDHFKDFAARASAECLLAFLRENLPATSAHEPQLRPHRDSTEAIAEYKRTLAEDRRIRCHDLRSLKGIIEGSHQTELELLDFAVAPSLIAEADEDGSRAAMLRNKIQGRDLSPAERREAEKELRQLENWRWDPREGHRKRRVAPISFAEALSRSGSPRLVVIGDPGTGKSVLTRLALLACVEGQVGHRARQLLGGDGFFRPDAQRAMLALRELLPIHVTLGRFASALANEPALSFTEYLRRQFPPHGPGEVLRDCLEDLLTRGQVLLLCDGLDEVPKEQRRTLVDALTAFLERAPDVRFLLTSRPDGYRPRLPGLKPAQLATLDASQKRQLVSRLHRLIEANGRETADSVARAHRRTQELLHAIQSPGWKLPSSNPLLLTLTALTRTDDRGAPLHRVIVFENFAITLLGEWRQLASTEEAAERLLDAWSAVAFELVRQEKRYGVVKAELLDMLSTELAVRAPEEALTAEKALQLALEAGLVHQDESTIKFWHSLFIEFLAARTLTPKGPGSADRILEVAHLSPVVLQLAVARLQHVLHAHAEIDRLITRLLARDEHGAEQLLRSGLRAASSCLADGCSFNSELILRIWTQWAEFLERMPPSPAWRDFERLAEQNPPRRGTLPSELLERFSRLDDRGVSEAQHGVARLLAFSSATLSPAARDACLRVMRRPYYSRTALLGALGLASTGDWSREVITALGRLGERSGSDIAAVSELVRRNLREEPRVRELLQELVRLRLPSEEPCPSGASGQPAAPASKEEEDQRDSRLSAACLLAIGGVWDDEIAQVVSQGLLTQATSRRTEDAKAVLRHCAEHPSTQESLLAWASEATDLGRHARELVSEQAPFLEGLPEKALERTFRSQAPLQGEMETMMASIADQQRSLVGLLKEWLEHEAEERRSCAARILCRLMPRDEALHAALSRGMAAVEPLSRVRWAHLTFWFAEELTDAAVKTLQDCARSSAPEVRKAVYSGDFQDQFRLAHSQGEGWIACASDSSLPGAVRLDAVMFLVHASFSSEHAVPLLRPLLDCEDPVVRRRAASVLVAHEPTHVRAAAITAEKATRAPESRPVHLPKVTAEVAAEVTRAILRGLPRELPAKSYKPWEAPWEFWGSKLAEFASADLSSVKHLIQAVELPGMAGEAATCALERLSGEHREARLAIGERLAHAANDCQPEALFRLVTLGLMRDDTKPLAIQVSRLLDPALLSQEKLSWLAFSLHKHAPEDAARMWRHCLQGGDPWRVLEAACGLARFLPEALDASFESVLSRLLNTREPLLRVYAARIALAHALLETESLATLVGCLQLREPGAEELDNRWLVDAIEARAIGSKPHGHEIWETLHYDERRVDFAALHALLRHRPDRGTNCLKEWLDDPEWLRFTTSVKLLVAWAHPREPISTAFLARLSSAPAERLSDLTKLADEHGFYGPELVERLLARYEPGSPSSGEVMGCLHRWLKIHPEIWTILWRQHETRRKHFEILLPETSTPTRDAVAFAVESALRPSDDIFGPPGRVALMRWCRSSQEKTTPAEPPGEPPPSVSTSVKSWLQELLLEHSLPSAPDVILRFDNLAVLAGMSPEYRLQLLNRSLAVELEPNLPDSTQYLESLAYQAGAAIRMLELKSADARIPPLLQTALHTSSERSALATLSVADALLPLQPADGAIQRSLLRTLGHRDAPLLIAGLLETLSRAGLTHEEIVDAMGECLGVEPESRPSLHPFLPGEHWRGKAPDVFDALAQWGCPLPLRESLLRRFIRLNEETLPAKEALALANRAELTPVHAVRLLLILLARVEGIDLDSVGRQWMERFAAPPYEEDRKRWSLSYWKNSLLVSRLGVLSMLARVNEPVLVDTILAELAALPVEEFLAVYRRARDGNGLADSEWAELVGWLSSRPGDANAPRFAREWLNLGLWNARAPDAVESLIRPE